MAVSAKDGLKSFTKILHGPFGVESSQSLEVAKSIFHGIEVRPRMFPRVQSFWANRPKSLPSHWRIGTLYPTMARTMANSMPPIRWQKGVGKFELSTRS